MTYRSKVIDLLRSKYRFLITPHKWGVILFVLMRGSRKYMILDIHDLWVKSYGPFKVKISFKRSITLDL